MKKSILTLVAILATTGMAFGQNSASQDVAISGNVLQAIQLSVNNATLSLGTMVAGTAGPSISATSSSTMFTLTGNGTSTINVTFNPVTLTGSNGGTLTFTPTIVGDASSANQSGAAALTSPGTVVLGGTNYSAANYYFWLGGDIGNVPAAQTPGTYSGTFTLTVAY